MNKLSTDERNLLRYYAETARILHGSGRGVVHQHLLSMGYIEERTVNMQELSDRCDAGGPEGFGL